jgi:hypothetical protein
MYIYEKNRKSNPTPFCELVLMASFPTIQKTKNTYITDGGHNCKPKPTCPEPNIILK